ncbi:MAG: uncharacterized LabA/DUF88 family protein [Candidatus Azotimanducaceae bacterium]|jgi:uncharacterized LabA/DUF88 family protein
MKKTPNNIAYIDGQNLYLGTTKRDPEWEVNLTRFRVFLEEKYQVKKAYYYLGYVQDGSNYQKLYDDVQDAGFHLVFREHNSAMKGTKKGNVDSDIIFSIMKRLYLQEDFNKVVLVSGDGDYKQLVDFLIEQKKFDKILFPKQQYASSLYKRLGEWFKADLSESNTRKKIGK